MSAFYTSYETSVALREAGAPQESPDLPAWLWTTYEGRLADPMLTHADYAVDALSSDTVRAFRLDEILEALEKLGTLEIEHAPPGDAWHVQLIDDNARGRWSNGTIACCGAVTRKPRLPDGQEPEGPAPTTLHRACRWWPTPVEAAAACYLAVLRAAREAKP